jgi:hypothetical protein
MWRNDAATAIILDFKKGRLGPINLLRLKLTARRTAEKQAAYPENEFRQPIRCP